jgi:hypothetical protein
MFGFPRDPDKNYRPDANMSQQQSKRDKSGFCIEDRKQIYAVVGGRAAQSTS